MGQNKRTITHLQSLSYPAEHYYFDRRLSNRQAVALAGGQSEPETMPGFTGRVSKAEMLCPAWAGAKRALILAQLHWKDE
jgi:prenyltransferase beta subunit